MEPPPTPVPSPPAPPESDTSDVAPSRARTLGVAGAVLLLGAGAVIGVLLVRSKTSVEAATLKAGWSRQAGPAFTLGLPPGWRSFPTTMDEKAFADLEKSDPARAAILRAAFGGEVSPFVKFLAFDVGTPVSEAFVTNMQVLVLPAPNGLDAFVDVDAVQLSQADGIASSVEKQRIVLPAGEAGIVSARLRLAGASQVAVVIHYALVVDDVGFILQFTTLADDLVELGPEFEEVARTFRFA